MSFTPLNKQEETEHDIEKHIREVELENALKLYQDALKLHYKRDWDGAFDAYDSLLASDVLQDVLHKGVDINSREFSHGSTPSKAQSSVVLLPYLLFKNHGMLLLERLKSEIDVSELETIQDTVQQVILEFATALSFDSGDRVLWRQIARLSQYLGLDRVTRFAIEAEICDTESLNTLQQSLCWGTGSTYHYIYAKATLRRLLDTLQDRYSRERLELGPEETEYELDVHNDFDWLITKGPIQLQREFHEDMPVHVLTVRPASCSWYALARAMIEKHRVSSGNRARAPVHFVIDIPEWETWSNDHSQSSEDEYEMAVEDLSARSDVSDPLLHPGEIRVRDTNIIVMEAIPGSQYFESDHVNRMGNSVEVTIREQSVAGSDSLGEDVSTNSSSESELESPRATTEVDSEMPLGDSIAPSEMSDDQSINRSDDDGHDDEDQDAAGSDVVMNNHMTGIDRVANPDVTELDRMQDQDDDNGSEEDEELHENEEPEDAPNEYEPVDEDFDEINHEIDEEHEMHAARDSPPRSRSRSPEMTSAKRMATELNAEDDLDLDDLESNTRASKRVKLRTSQASTAHKNDFHDALQITMGPLEINFTSLFKLDSTGLDMDEDDIEYDQPQKDLKTLLLYDWTDDRAQAARFVSNSISPAFSKTLILSYPPIDHPKRDHECERAQLVEFASRIERGRSYYRHVNVELLAALFGGTNFTGPSYMSYAWTSSFHAIVQKLIAAEEHLLLDTLNVSLYSCQRESDHDFILRNFMVAQGLFELSLDALVVSEKSRIESSAAILKDQVMFDRVHRWNSRADELRVHLDAEHRSKNCLDIRFSWASILLAQLSGAPVEETIQSYRQLKQTIELQMSTQSLLLPNCQALHVISTESIELEIAKFSTIDFFNEVFDSTQSLEHKLILKKLEPVLLPSETSLSVNLQIVEEYLSRSPLEFRLQLWDILVKALKSAERPGDVAHSSFRSMELLYSLFHGALGSTTSNRQVVTLQYLERASLKMKDAFLAITSNPMVLEEWSHSRCVETLNSLVKYLSVLHVFVQYEDLVAEDDTLARTSLNYIRFRDRSRGDVVRSWICFYHISRKLLELTEQNLEILGHKLATLINVLHDELGTRGYCSLLNGALLELFEDEIFRLDRAETETDLVQILHCKYNISYQVGSFIPWDHSAKEMKLSVEHALRIIPFVLTFVPEKSPGLWLPKVDVLTAMQKLHEIVWPELETGSSYRRNQAILESYYSQEISPKQFKHSLIGELRIEARDFPRAHNMANKSWIALHNLSFTLGRVQLSMFKARNKNKSKGLTDLDVARSYFQQDLIVNPRRNESWQALAYINAAIVDTELSRDAQHILDQRQLIRRWQRETLLCHMMATSIFVCKRAENDLDPQASPSAYGDLLYDFAYSIYCAARAPFAMDCFTRESPKYIERGDANPILQHPPGVTYTEALSIASRCLHRASKDCTNRWKCFYYLGKVHAKLKLNPAVYLADYKNAIEAAPATSPVEQGPLLEPHYKMISAVQKALVTGSIEPSAALEFLTSTRFATRHVQPVVVDRTEVLRVIQAALLSLTAADKRHWHHRPVYRLAKMAHDGLLTADTDDNKNTQARLSAEALFTAKGSGGNLLSIWRPENERPGRHFYYANVYTNFYSDLLIEVQDMEGLRNFMRRVRKATQNILHHKTVWDKICSSFMTLSISESHIPQVDTVDFIDVVESSVFNQNATKLELATTQLAHDPPVLKVLKDFYEVRKLNGGLYDTNRIDDAIVNCYMVLYNDINSREEELLAPLAASQSVFDTTGLPVQPPNEAGQITSSANAITSLHGQAQPLPTAQPSLPTPLQSKSRGRVKEPKITKVSRRDILNKSFALGKPKAPEKDVKLRTEPVRIRSRHGSISSVNVAATVDATAEKEDHDEISASEQIQEESVQFTSSTD